MQSFYQFYQKRLQESSDNTNNLFIEAFDRANLDDVTITENPSSDNYAFEDTVGGEKYYYKVGISVPSWDIDDIKADFTNRYRDLYSQFKAKYPDSWIAAAISLTVDGKYSSSKLGNHVFVYSKMMACIQNTVSKHKPLLLMFSGYESAMELAYDSLIKMSQRTYPQDAYVPYESSYYIRKEVYDLIPNDDSLELAKKEREEYLKYIRKEKNRYKAHRAIPDPADL